MWKHFVEKTTLLSLAIIVFLHILEKWNQLKIKNKSNWFKSHLILQMSSYLLILLNKRHAIFVIHEIKGLHTLMVSLYCSKIHNRISSAWQQQSISLWVVFWAQLGFDKSLPCSVSCNRLEHGIYGNIFCQMSLGGCSLFSCYLWVIYWLVSDGMKQPLWGCILRMYHYDSYGNIDCQMSHALMFFIFMLPMSYIEWPGMVWSYHCEGV